MPDRIYVIDAKGRIAYKGDPGPAGFKATAIPGVLDKLLNITLASSLGFPPEQPMRPGGGAGGPGMPRDRLPLMLSRAGLDDKDTQHILKAVDQRLDAYREMLKARMALMAATRGQGDAAQALKSFDDAEKKYAAALAKIDQALDQAIGFRRRPEVQALLAAMGLIGNHPAPPLSGLMNLGSDGFPGPPRQP